MRPQRDTLSLGVFFMKKRGFFPLFLLGGGMYVTLEKLWRGYSHPSMFLLGGICFHLIGTVDRRCRQKRMWQRCALCALLITAAEFVCGCIVNLYLKLKVWDYHRFRTHILGQVCLPYTLLWGALSAVGMPLYRALQTATAHIKKRTGITLR